MFLCWLSYIYVLDKITMGRGPLINMCIPCMAAFLPTYCRSNIDSAKSDFLCLATIDSLLQLL